VAEINQCDMESADWVVQICIWGRYEEILTAFKTYILS